MFVFGGYGGAGFARRDFNDVSALDLETWEWRPIETTGMSHSSSSTSLFISCSHYMHTPPLYPPLNPPYITYTPYTPLYNPYMPTGEIPDARSGHQGVAMKELLYVIGGWNSMVQFDAHILYTLIHSYHSYHSYTHTLIHSYHTYHSYTHTTNTQIHSYTYTLIPLIPLIPLISLIHSYTHSLIQRTSIQPCSFRLCSRLVTRLPFCT